MLCGPAHQVSTVPEPACVQPADTLAAVCSVANGLKSLQAVKPVCFGLMLSLFSLLTCLSLPVRSLLTRRQLSTVQGCWSARASGSHARIYCGLPVGGLLTRLQSGSEPEPQNLAGTLYAADGRDELSACWLTLRSKL